MGYKNNWMEIPSGTLFALFTGRVVFKRAVWGFLLQAHESETRYTTVNKIGKGGFNHEYGMDLKTDQADSIVDLLYDLRKGMEREAG